MKITGHGAGRADDHVPRPRDLVDNADHLRLGRQRPVAEGVGALDRGIPLLRESRGPLPVAVRDRPALQRLGQGQECRPGVGVHGHPRVLDGVQTTDVDVDEPDSGMLEGRP